MVNPLVAYLHCPRTEAINSEYPRKWFISKVLTPRFELGLTALFSQSSYLSEEPLPPLPVDIISRRRYTIPCHANILYCFKEHLWSMWESNPLAGEHSSTDPFACSSTAANYSTPFSKHMGKRSPNLL